MPPRQSSNFSHPDTILAVLHLNISARHFGAYDNTNAMVNLVQCNFLTKYIKPFLFLWNEAFFTFLLFCPVQTDSKFSHGWLSCLSWLDPRDLSKGLWSIEWRVKIVHRKDSDRLPGYFVLRSGCQIVQGAVLTPASTLILGSSTGWVVHHHFFATDHILQNCYAWDGRGGCHSIC